MYFWIKSTPAQVSFVIFQQKWYTLVELIVVLAIVAILTTTAFVSYSGYSIEARDTLRKTDMSNIKALLKSQKQKNGNYGQPTGAGTNIVRASQAGAQFARSGKLNSDTPLDGSSRVFKDPKTNKEYMYGTIRSGQEFQIGMTFETAKNVPSAFVDGDYQAIASFMPSLLVASSAATLDIDNATNASTFILNGSTKNIPYDLNGNIYKTATTLADAISGSETMNSSHFNSCLQIFEASKSMGAGNYTTRTSTWMLTTTNCTMTY